MLDLSALVLGLGWGLRHATDADHVAVVTAMLQREPGAMRAMRVAVLWGLGHTASFLALGLLTVFAGVRLPASFEPAVELLVAGMLVGLGAWHLLRRSGPESSTPGLSPVRPFAVASVSDSSTSASCLRARARSGHRR